MQLHHEFVVPLGIQQAWDAFNDLERIAPAFPGASVTGVDGDSFTGTAKVRLGPISLQYTGTGRFASRDAAGRRAVIEASGTDRRGNGTAGATITASLQEEGEGSTRVLLDTDLRITGRPAQFGRGVIQEVGGRILEQFAANLTSLLGTAAAGAPGTGSRARERAAATSEPAAPRTDPATTSAGGAAPGDAAVPSGPLWTTPSSTGTRATGLAPGGLDLGSVVGPALLQRYGVTVVAVVVTAVVTWVVARRRGA